jgi:hypothetical protein
VPNINQKPLLGELIDYGNPLSQGLVGFWLMNEGGGNKVHDLSGNDVNFTFNGDVIWGANERGSVLEFPGTNDYIESTPTKGSYNKFTIVTRFKYNSLPHSLGTLFCWGERVADQPFTWVYFTGTYLALQFTDGAGSNTETVGYTFNTGKWYDVAVTVDFTNQIYEYYINGIYIGQDTSAATTYAMTNEKIFLGAWYNGTSYELDGQKEFLLLYSRILMANEIALLYRKPFCFIGKKRRIIYSEIAGAPPAGGAVPIFSKDGIHSLIFGGQIIAA